MRNVNKGGGILKALIKALMILLRLQLGFTTGFPFISIKKTLEILFGFSSFYFSFSYIKSLCGIMRGKKMREIGGNFLVKDIKIVKIIKDI